MCLLVVAGACSGGGEARAPFRPIDSDGVHLRDELGRIALFRGVNARVEGIFDVTFDDGREPLEPIPPLDDADCRRMRELGFDLLRLAIDWSGIEPERDEFSEAYLDRVAAAVDCAGSAGLLVLLDLHQDAYSKEIGEDGAPLWAIEPPPAMLLEGPLDDLDARRQSRQVLDAFDSFFAAGDPHGLQAEFIAMLEEVAARFASDPAVIGFELFNEPVAAPEGLDPFHHLRRSGRGAGRRQQGRPPARHRQRARRGGRLGRPALHRRVRHRPRLGQRRQLDAVAGRAPRRGARLRLLLGLE